MSEGGKILPRNDRRVCAYCKETRTLTREHIFPAAIIAANKSSDRDGRFWLSKIGKEIPSEPVIKDVCGVCNNGFLSNLDSYGVKFFKEFCLDEIDREVEFHSIHFDYHLLKRWLMKIGFNSARANEGFGLNAYEHMLPYIFGDNLKLGRSASLFCAINHPQEVPKADQIKFFGTYDSEFVWRPVVNRVSKMHVTFPGIGSKWIKVISLRGVSLMYTFFDPSINTTQNDQRDFERVFLSEMPFIRRLTPGSSSEIIPTGGLGAWETFRNSRSQITFQT